MRWDGTQWAVVPSPNYGTFDSYLLDVDALATNDIWAVGRADDDSQFRNVTLVLHWDGTQWSVVPSPNPGQYYEYYLEAVDAYAPGDVWATGTFYVGEKEQGFALHWDGTQWTRLIAAYLPPSNFLSDVAVRGANDVWFAGTGPNGAVVERWDGSQWHVAELPSARNAGLTALALGSTNEAWSIGVEYTGDRYVNIAYHYTGSACATPTTPPSTSTATGTPTPGSPTRTPLPTTTPDCTLPWSVVDSPNVGSGDNELTDVVAISPTDVWAVGHYRDPALFGRYKTLTVHWDGVQWSIVPSPSVPGISSLLYAVTATASNDVWAVGDFAGYTLVMHWDGTEWSLVFSPDFYRFDWLYDVRAISPNDVWAVGTYYAAASTYPLTIHWDGTEWSLVSSPEVYEQDTLYGVDGASANDVWAAGSTSHFTLIERWNGTQWSVISSPSPNGYAELFGLDVVSANDAWAVGYYGDGPNNLPLALRWNGSAWTYVPMPGPGAGYSQLRGVSAIAANDVWAVGHRQTDVDVVNTLTEHWNGSNWSLVPSPDVTTGDNRLRSVTAAPGGGNNVWAVGYYSDGNTKRTLIQRYVGQQIGCSTPTPIPSATRTATWAGTGTPVATFSSTSTRTLTPTAHAQGTFTAPPVTPSATTCTLSFTDVPEGSTFYPFVRCMACRGIVNGYTSGCETGNPCFRPTNHVTRGQLSKIVSNAAGFSEPVSGQSFEDVPPGSTFYDFIERLSSRGYISGYACGGLSEPCIPPGDLPYFRPSADITRGQITKIVANAAMLTDPPGAQIFEDVAPGSTFYTFTNRLASRGIMSGYPCGSPEPCVPPNNYPYFRPGNNATRGQSSKIVSNTFFPDCEPVPAEQVTYRAISGSRRHLPP